MMERKLAVITGADGGIGTEITRAVACAGYDVIMACYSSSKAETKCPKTFSQFNGKKQQSKLGIAIDRNTPETSLSPPKKKIREIQFTDCIGTRHHIDNAGSLSHQGKQKPRQEIRTYIIYTDRPL